MHDTFLTERIYETLLKLCQENKLIKLYKVNLAVNTDSHISENSLRELLVNEIIIFLVNGQKSLLKNKMLVN